MFRMGGSTGQPGPNQTYRCSEKTVGPPALIRLGKEGELVSGLFRNPVPDQALRSTMPRLRTGLGAIASRGGAFLITRKETFLTW